MDMEEIIEEIMDEIKYFDESDVKCENISDEEFKAIAFAVRERAKEAINESDIEDKIDSCNGDIDEAINEYTQELLSDTYQSIIQNGDSLVDKYLEDSALSKKADIKKSKTAGAAR